MPEGSIDDAVYGLGISDRDMQREDVIVLQQRFRVSYTAMVKRLCELKWISETCSEELRALAANTNEAKEKLRALTLSLQGDIRLVEPTNDRYVTPRLTHAAFLNYRHGNISMKKLAEILRLAFVPETAIKKLVEEEEAKP